MKLTKNQLRRIVQEAFGLDEAEADDPARIDALKQHVKATSQALRAMVEAQASGDGVKAMQLYNAAYDRMKNILETLEGHY